jgi:hypothetical protein
LKAKGASVTYTKYPGIDHGGIVSGGGAKHATAFVVKRLGR